MGRPTVETHQHFDADGNHTGTTVVTVPSRWTEESKGWELAYQEYLETLCDCGVPKHIAHDPERAWAVGWTECRRCAAIAQVMRKRDDDDAALEKAGAKTYPSARKWTAKEHDWRSEIAHLDRDLELMTDARQDGHSQIPGGRGGSDREHHPPGEGDRRLS